MKTQKEYYAAIGKAHRYFTHDCWQVSVIVEDVRTSYGVVQLQIRQDKKVAWVVADNCRPE
jgi:hypothetical protein